MTVVLMVIRMPYSRIAERDNEQWQLNLYPLTIIERDPGFSDQLFNSLVRLAFCSYCFAKLTVSSEETRKVIFRMLRKRLVVNDVSIGVQDGFVCRLKIILTG